jgi:hypothetical protein
MSMERSYDNVLRDLEGKHRHCAEEIKRLTAEEKSLFQAINILRQIHAGTQQEVLPFTNGNAHTGNTNVAPIPKQDNPLPRASGQYGGLSTRWAILYLLAEFAAEPMGRSEIAKALTEGGITSSAQSFASNVSAVLSGMANDRKEVVQVENGGYQITEHGREVWEGVKRTPQWASRAIYVAS